jgi:hypothetical protein
MALLIVGNQKEKSKEKVSRDFTVSAKWLIVGKLKNKKTLKWVI